ncbi:pullulanase-type alpha-1,6-glucosidase [Georgenia satyanarayanai]|uniref:pullulanase-type alpha-1,6-glucosidase n=1 Tax=Georgenia satyanarayanai TaxID=860221 RepID=UPI001264957F|nr:pullulanase-type alpha-1,6-glucosidase [Georgenia satyanarayanai]
MSARSARPRAAVATLATASLLASGLVAVASTLPAAADDAVVVLAGNLQSELGCPADWAPDCTGTALAPTGTEGVYAAELTVPAGSWEYKVAVGGTWDEAYGVGGGEENYALHLAGAADVRFTFDHADGLLALEVLGLEEGYTDADAALVAEPVRQPGADEQFYFVMTDRFADGDAANNTGGIDGGRLDHGFDPTDKGFYHGGDIAGLHERLDYIEGLGTTAIWLTPSFKNRPVQGEGADASAGYHGYWITDFTQIDPHLGTNDELEALIDDAHDRGIKVYFDIITNHTADVIDYAEGAYSYIDMATSPYRDAEGATFDPGDHAGTGTFPELDAETSFPYTPVVDEGMEDVKVPGWLNDVTLYHNRGNSTWEGESVTYGDFDGLDDLMTEHPTVVDGFVEVYQDWIDLGIDGFRIDTAKHVNIEFWEEWTTEVLDHARAQGNEEFFMFGEVYDADARLLSPYVRNTDMNGVLDFAYQSAAVNYAKGFTAAGLSGLFAADAYYTTPTTSAHDLPTFLGNHDMGRVGYFLQGAGDELDRSVLAHSLMYLTRGQPVVYYGDEQGFVGQGGDKDARQSLFASEVRQYQDEATLDGDPIGAQDHYATDAPLYTHIAELAGLRSSTPALATGAQVELHADDGAGVYAFARVDREERVEHVVALNNTTTAATATFTTLTPGATYTSLHGDATSVTADASGRVTLTVPGLDAVVLVADRTVGAPEDPGTMTLGPAQGGRLDGVAPVSADVADDVWTETSFAYRLVGSEEWTPLGTAEGDAPRVFHDVSGLPTGTLVEYRAVSVDAAGHRAAASTVGSVGQAVDGSAPEQPGGDLVTVPGSHNAAMGCPGDWQPDCQAAALTLGADGVYSATFDLPAGSYEYKVAVGGSWDVNYGAGGVPGGDNVAYTHEGGTITFFYDPVTHRFANTAEGPVITLPGSFQSQVGCPGDWQPDCMATWMTDPDGDGTYEWSTTALATGSYEVKVAHGRSWDENYGADGVRDGANISFSATAGKLVSFSYDLASHVLTVEVTDPPLAGTGQLAAHWLDETTIAWPTSLLPAGTEVSDLEWSLHHAAAGGMEVRDGEVHGADGSTALTLVGEGLPEALAGRFPHLADHLALRVEGLSSAQVEEVLTGQVQVLQTDGAVASAFTGVQVPGVLDDLYAEDAADRVLGVDWAEDGTPSLALWAPTATDVDLQLWPGGLGGAPETVDMDRQDDGTWTVEGEPGWEDAAYRFGVTVYAPSVDEVVTNDVTDPYAVGLTENSTHSVLVDLDDPRWAPGLWTDTPRPVVERPVDRTIYELHVRDFSISDETVPEELRGTYLAFAQEDSDGMRHLRTLADAGMNTVHLLPTFDIATIEEDPAARTDPEVPDAGPASEEQQAVVSATRDLDGFNWGYDPWHFSTPEGSYAVERDGGSRTAEFRTMVGGLHDAGLQVVLDKVYNHTSASGQDDRSVLDRVVPGYYHRLSATGSVETSTCCQNVATEHEMAEKLMVDSVLTWATDYGVDGFRFDLMGHHSRDNMVAVREALDALTLEDDGVDGESVYVYGEGWNFGEVADNARFHQATQGQLDGTGIGTFSDRLRDAVRGGGPFDEDQRTVQGFGSGSFTDPNAVAEGTPEEQAARLAHQTDLVRLGLAGNLADFSFLTFAGEEQTGAEIDYNGQPAGYATQPDEVVTYVDAHDNETLFDNLVLKLPVDTAMEDRVRMNTLSLATTALSQTPSFWHAGTDLLRSKSLDRNSYNSGDHFNRLDWSMRSNTFGVGLPPAEDNSGAWEVMAPLLENPGLRPEPADIEHSAAMAQDLLELRFSTELFRLGSAELIHEKVTFPGSGPDATPGLLVMAVDDTAGEQDVDPALDGVLAVFNASPDAITEQVDGFAGRDLALSPVQQDGADDVVRGTAWDADTGTVTVPARTVAVLVEAQAQVEPTPTPTDPTPTDPSPTPSDGSGPDDDAGRPGGKLPHTGADLAVPVVVALLLLLAGSVLAARRRTGQPIG